jgi:hypothetical protein
MIFNFEHIRSSFPLVKQSPPGAESEMLHHESAPNLISKIQKKLGAADMPDMEVAPDQSCETANKLLINGFHFPRFPTQVLQQVTRLQVPRRVD